MTFRYLDTPVGRLLLARDDAGLRLIHFVGPGERGPAKAGPYVPEGSVVPEESVGADLSASASSGREAARQAVLAGQTAARSAPADPPKREREGGQVGPSPDWNHDDAAFGDVVSQLGEYFEGRRRQFDLPLAPAGTPFQQRVWSALLDIPYGETISYGELASRIGQKSASRAVGLANGSNPLPIVIPCHRVIGANGKLTGYGGGLPIKERLLAHERGERRLL